MIINKIIARLRVVSEVFLLSTSAMALAPSTLIALPVIEVKI